MLVVFFATASALSKLPGGGERDRRGGRQVIANGSLAAVAAVAVALNGAAMLVFLGAIAAAAADTWATEVGVRLGGRPRSILTLRRQAPGTSGAVSVVGSAAGAAAALAVAAAGRWLLDGVDWRAAAAVGLAGLAGSLADSILGAGLQATYRCAACGATPEVVRHEGCPVRAERVSGVPGLDNDVVNWLATCVGGAVAVLLS